MFSENTDVIDHLHYSLLKSMQLVLILNQLYLIHTPTVLL
jgi:hypothetical protein